jgi:hypothetical protein
VADVGWLIDGESGADTCPLGGQWYEDTWPNLWVPRVTRWLAKWWYVKFMGVHGVRPPDLPHCVSLHKHPRPLHRLVFLIKNVCLNIFKFSLCNHWTGGRAGA